MRKKIISVLLTAVVLVTIFTVICTAARPTLTVVSAEAKPGDVVELAVVLENNPGINTFSLGFDYDKSKLILNDVTLNDELGGQFVYAEKAVWLNNKDVVYDGKILTLEFKVLASAESGDTKVRVTYAPGDISNYDEKNVSFKIVAGEITIGGDEAEPSFWQKILSFFVWIYEGIIELFSFVN